ncbi:MAG: peptide deformylase [Bacteroidetes bacterium HGW-Bacteroidetes-2]|jgi:peptide deformylase|nr:MAG: peptide deformylase [Bacteroidetes bacterium HGW-Bacteroidetes-2]
MILPIVAYGDVVLRKKGSNITAEYPNLNALIENMYETMYSAHGVGLAAPQIGLAIRLFIVDTEPFSTDEDLEDQEKEYLSNFKQTFINPTILIEEGDEWAFNEGCLSIPDIREDVFRQPKIKLEYFDENFKKHIEEFDGLIARVIQHEYDHIEGILFTDRLSPLKKRIIKGKLMNISKGKIDVDYRMKFPNISKKR